MHVRLLSSLPRLNDVSLPIVSVSESDDRSLCRCECKIY